MARRGAYAKGIAKREEILTRALDVIAREGYSGASVRELAAAVELSEAGLLHYFDSKAELFTAILRKRDEMDLAVYSPLAEKVGFDEVREGYVRVIRHNSEVPGVVQLFSQLAVEAVDPAHPAHEYFLQRGAAMRELFASAFEHAQQDGRIASDADPQALARVMQAAADGLQVQWMLDSRFDMAAAIDALFAALVRPGPTDAG